MERVNLLADWVLGDLRPDLTILLDAPVETGMERTGRRGDPDRLDSERAEFYQRVREAYLQLAAAEQDRFVVVDASRDLGEVSAAIDAITESLLIDTDSR